MLLRTGGVKLLDFGIARATMKLRANTPIGGLIKGKLSYLSPEQVRGQKVDGRSDVFSLGVVLWECLTGVRLFYNPNDLETMRNVLHRQVPKPSEMRHGLAESLDQIVMKALDRDLDRRYPDAGAMAADLEEYLREVRFSSETLVQLLEELFADEDSARELPLPGDGSSSAIEIKIGTSGRPASSSDSLQPPPQPGRRAGRRRREQLRHRQQHPPAVRGGGPPAAPPRDPGVGRRGGAAGGDAVRGRAHPRPARPRARSDGGSADGRPPRPTRAGSSCRTPAPTAAPAAPAPDRRRPQPRGPIPPAARERADSRVRPAPARSSGNGAVASMSVDPARGRKALARGMQALNSGEYMRAVQELENACQASPRDPEALRALAEAEFELARYGRALGHARKAAMLAPARGPLPHAGGGQPSSSSAATRRPPTPMASPPPWRPATPPSARASSWRGTRSAAATRPRARSGAKSKPRARVENPGSPPGAGIRSGHGRRPSTPPCRCPSSARGRSSTSWPIRRRRAPGCRCGCSPTRC